MDASCNAKPAVVAVVGPTATGKTALGVALAQQFSGEVISADSMQIYKGLDVGTAKVTPQETCGIPHHGVDILTPEKTFSVADFTALAGEYIQDITARGHLPLLVGGTGLYVQSLLYGVRFTAEKAPDGLREQLTAELESLRILNRYRNVLAVNFKCRRVDTAQHLVDRRSDTGSRESIRLCHDWINLQGNDRCIILNTGMDVDDIRSCCHFLDNLITNFF